MQQTTLPHRVARSTKDLASATLSGATFELNDPRESKHAGSSSQASTSFEHLSSGSAQARPGLDARSSSFRNEIDESHREKAEQDFERFQQLDDFQSEFTACLRSLRDTLEQQEGSYDPKSKEIVKPPVTSTIDANKSTSRHEVASESVVSKTIDFARTAAVRRVNQIGAHLQRNLAMQTLQPEACTQSRALMNETMSMVTEEVTRQVDDGRRSTVHSDEAESSTHGIPNAISPQYHETVASGDSAPKESPEKEDDVLQRQFHCPYYACHRNLKLYSASSSSSNQRKCVHVGCEFVAETFNPWAEHIHMPHHDLLGSL